MQRSRLFLLTLLLALAAGTAAFRPQPHSPTVVIVVRHAEKEAEPAADPPLSEAGRARALALVQVAADAGVAAVYHTPYRRTRDTGAPTADSLGVPLKEYDPRGDPQALRADILANYEGKVVLVVGHSNTVPAIASALAGRPVRPMGDDEYDRLVVVAIPNEGMPAVVQGRYGPGH